MPRKSGSTAVQKGGTTTDSTNSEKESAPRRSTRAASRNDTSSGSANRSRRSPAAVQTNVPIPVAESRVTRSRSSSKRQRSASPADNIRTRSSRETSLESPASRVKTARRSTGLVNYQESEGEEDVVPAVEKNEEEEEYNVEDDMEESDSEESNRSRTRSRPVSKSPPKIRSRGRGRPPKTEGKVTGRSSDNTETEEYNPDDENDKTLEVSDATDMVTSSRKHQVDTEPESGRRTRGSGRKPQNETSARSTRSEKMTKNNTENKITFSKPVRNTRGRKISPKEVPVVPAEENKTDDKEEEMEVTEPVPEKRKRKLEFNSESQKRIKLDETTTEKKNTNEMQELTKSVQSQENSKSPVSEKKENVKDISDKEVSISEISNKSEENTSSENKMVSDEPSITETCVKDDVKKKEQINLSVTDKSSVIEVSENKTVDSKNDEIMEINTIEESSEKEETSKKPAKHELNISAKKIENISDTDFVKETVIPENLELDKKTDISTNEIELEKDDKKEHSVSQDETNPTTTIVSPKIDIDDGLSEMKSDDQENTATNLSSEGSKPFINPEGIKDTSVNEPKEQEALSSTHHEKEESSTVTVSMLMPSQKSDSQNPSKKSVESDIQENKTKIIDSSDSVHLKKDIELGNISSTDSEVSKTVQSEVNNKDSLAVHEVLSVNGANTCIEKSDTDLNAIDMSKVSDSSASETEILTNEASSVQVVSSNVLECATTKANGAHDNIPKQSNQPSDSDLLNRKNVYNPSLSEETKCCLQNRMFSLVSYNLSAMSNELSFQNEKLLLELKRTKADIICLQEIKKTYYHETLEPNLNALEYKSVFCIPENKFRGLGIFYKTSMFNLIKQTEIPMQKVIDQDLETSSLENADKTAVRNFLQKCGHMLLAQLSTVNGDHTLTVANVLFPPSDTATHALQMSSLVREVVNFADDISRPHILCGSFNMAEGGVAYQLLREGYLNNEMIEELQQRKDVILPGKENDTLVNLLWKAFQHPSSNLRSCYATVLGHELCLGGEKSVTSPDLLWYSSDSLETIGILDIIPTDENNTSFVSLKADIAYIC